MSKIFIENILKQFTARYYVMKLCFKTNLCTTEFAGLKRMQSCVEIVAEILDIA